MRSANDIPLYNHPSLASLEPYRSQGSLIAGQRETLTETKEPVFDLVAIEQ